MFLMDGMEKVMSDDKKKEDTFGGKVTNDMVYFTAGNEKTKTVNVDNLLLDDEESKTPKGDMTPQIRNRNASGSGNNMLSLRRIPSNRTIGPESGAKKRQGFINRGQSPSTLSEYINRSKDFQIADVNFSFKNREILHLLTERGKAVLDNDHDSKRLIEAEIKAVIEEDHEQLSTPV